MKTNEAKLKTQTKTRLNIKLNQTLTMNAAHDIKVLEYQICIYSIYMYLDYFQEKVMTKFFK